MFFFLVKRTTQTVQGPAWTFSASRSRRWPEYSALKSLLAFLGVKTLWNWVILVIEFCQFKKNLIKGLCLCLTFLKSAPSLIFAIFTKTYVRCRLGNVLSAEWQPPWRQLLWRIAGFFIVITYEKGNVQKTLLYCFLFWKIEKVTIC